MNNTKESKPNVEIDKEHFEEKEFDAVTESGDMTTEKIMVPKTGHKGLNRELILRMHSEQGDPEINPGEKWGYRRIANHFDCSVQNIRHHIKAEDKETITPESKTEITGLNPEEPNSDKAEELNPDQMQDLIEKMEEMLKAEGLGYGEAGRFCRAIVGKDYDPKMIAESFMPIGTKGFRKVVSEVFDVSIGPRLAKAPLIEILGEMKIKYGGE